MDEAIEKECKDCTVGIDTDYVINQSTLVRPDVFVACHEIDERLLKTLMQSLRSFQMQQPKNMKDLKKNCMKEKEWIFML